MLNALAWTAIVLLVLNVLLSVANVGKPRRPLSGGEAVAVVIVDGLFIALLVALTLR